MGQMALMEPPVAPAPSTGWVFRVDGVAVPQGSWVPFIDGRTGQARAKPSNEKDLERWRKHVRKWAEALRPEGWEPIDGPVLIQLWIVRQRSENDYLADGVTLRKGARRYPDTAPDSDKLERAIFDALTGVAFTNDGRIVSNLTTQRYTELDEGPHVTIRVVAL